MKATSLSSSEVTLMKAETAVEVRGKAEEEEDAELVEKVKLDAKFL